MTDAGEKLRERIVNHPHYPPNDLDDTFDIVRDELERAAKAMCYWCREGNVPEELDEIKTANGDPLWHKHSVGSYSKCEATAIRKLKE